jgi:hypothetical protein
MWIFQDNSEKQKLLSALIDDWSDWITDESTKLQFSSFISI